MTTETETNMLIEIQQLAVKLAAPGIPPSAIGQALVAAGAAMLAQSLGTSAAAKLLRTSADALDEARQ